MTDYTPAEREQLLKRFFKDGIPEGLNIEIFKLDVPLDGAYRTPEEQEEARAEFEEAKAAGWTGDPQPFLYPDGCREEVPAHLGDSPEHATVKYMPRTFKRYQMDEQQISEQESQAERLKQLHDDLPPAFVAQADQWSAFIRNWVETVQGSLLQGTLDPAAVGIQMAQDIHEMCPTDDEKVALAMHAIMSVACNIPAEELLFP